MPKPLPIIHLTSPFSHTRLVHGLVALGYTYDGQSVPDLAVAQYLEDVYSEGAIQYPYMTISTTGEINAYVKRDHPQDVRSYTDVNSVAHFLDYAKRLGPPQVVDHEEYPWNADFVDEGN